MHDTTKRRGIALVITMAGVLAIWLGAPHERRAILPSEGSVTRGATVPVGRARASRSGAAPARATASSISASFDAERTAVVPPGFDLGKLMKRVHFAFHDRDGAAVGEHETYAIEARDGQVRLTPFHADPRQAGSHYRSGRTLEVETRGVARDGRSLTGGAAQRVAEDGSLEVSRGGVVESWHNDENGTEQRWRFESNPVGDGDLVVSVAMRGLAFRGETPGGLHFADRSGMGFRYGHGTWVDARGARTSVPAVWENGHVALRVPSSVVDGSAYPAVLDPVLGPEFSPDLPALGLAGGDHRRPTVAFGNGVYKVHWIDEFTRASAYYVYAARVSPAGVLIDVEGSRASLNFGAITNPAAASDGTTYMAVWNSTADSTLRGSLSAGGGGPAVSFFVSVPIPATAVPDIAFGTAEYLTVWENSGDIFGRVILPDGTFGTSLITICSAAGTQSRPKVAFDGTNYLVVWDDNRTDANGSRLKIFGARVTPSGTVLDATGFQIRTGTTTDVSVPAVASDGSSALVAWRTSTGRFEASRVVAGATAPDPTVVSVPVSITTRTAASVGVSFGGTDYLVTAGTWGAFVDASGALLTPTGFDLYAAATANVDVASDGAGGHLVVWEAYSDTIFEYDVYGGRVSDVGAPLDGIGMPISTTIGSQADPDVAFGVTSYLAVWEDRRSDRGGDVWGARIMPDGTVLDPNGIPIETDNVTDLDFHPAVDFDGTNFAVVWTASNAGAVYGQRIAQDGTKVGVETGIGTVGWNPRIAFDGTNHLIVATTNAGDARYVVVNTSLGNVAPAASLSTGAGTAAVETDGTNFLVAYGRSGTTYGRFISSAGVPQGLEFTIDLGTTPSIAFDGTNYLVVNTAGATRVTPAGTALDVPRLAIGGTSSRVAFDGTNFLVLRSDMQPTSTLTAARVSPSGALLDPVPSVVTTDARPGRFGVATDGQGDGLVVYAELDASVARNAARARTICSTTPSPTDATCDGIDDDCSGEADEDYVVVATTCGVGSCARTGARSCVLGVEVDSCAPGAPAADDQTCDGSDDDCNGVADDGFVPFSTTCGVGACASTGTLSCAGGMTIDSCSPGVPAPSDSDCDAIDDDCNGAADEDYVALPTTCGVGACTSAGVTTCAGGMLGDTCAPGTPAASDTTCDATDDDCNGIPDDGYVPTSTTCGVGACAATGLTTCTGGLVGDTCVPGVPAASDGDCDGIDDDCSGSADEDYLALPTTCGVGACASTGVTTCAGGVEADTCVSGAPAADDTSCDGEDDDCNGIADDGFVAQTSSCGTGACASTGTTSCSGGMETDSCTPGSPAPSDDDCNGLDDDCNGAADDGYQSVPSTCGVGACARSANSSCVSGVETVGCVPGPPLGADVTCDGVDDDCNGMDDDAFVATVTTCGVGACAAQGLTTCANGTLASSCVAGTPASDDVTCDGVDDDCNGAEDDGFVAAPTTCGVGACASNGTTSCLGGIEGDTCAPGTPAPDDATCDGVDDDCNGTADDGFVASVTACGVGACASTGVTSCAGGVPADSCVPGVGSAVDVTCDGLDDDCDGVADDDAFCAIDAGIDVSVPDAGFDAGIDDASTADAGADVGPDDAGSDAGQGALDGGPDDVGLDSGATTDAQSDLGLAPDASGSPDQGVDPTSSASGCSCRAGGSGSPANSFAGFLCGALVFARWARRRRRIGGQHPC